MLSIWFKIIYQTFEFTTMVNRSCLLPTFFLLSALLLADIALISGMAQVISRKANNAPNAPEDGLLLYGLVILPLIAVSMFIVIAMLTIYLRHGRAEIILKIQWEWTLVIVYISDVLGFLTIIFVYIQSIYVWNIALDNFGLYVQIILKYR